LLFGRIKQFRRGGGYTPNLVEEGLRALLFGRIKQFRRGGGYTPNLEKHILLEKGVSSFNRREKCDAFKVI